ncbi:MAG: 1-acyl-sn-glycerol-3-phosphate acyltransferase [Gemmatimonadota bacterium]|nr:1-acyl-sn-glycerol-3-phosphate acyltransferase [Gemmatimonadota bacterium]
MLPRIITRLVGWAVAVFYDVERTGPTLPAGPVLVTANHPNALVDPLVIFHTGGRITRPLAKAPLFEQLLVGTVLKGLGGLPVYRKEDDPALMHMNDRTFDAAIAALHAGEAVQIYPEGQSHSEPALTRIRTGAARIALLAEQRADWGLGLHIQPVGLTYTRKHLFRGCAMAAFGEPLSIAPYRARYQEDERATVNELTAEIRRRLEALTLNFERADDQALVDVAERIWTRGKGLARPREREPMADRLPRLQRFAEGVRWLRQVDATRLDALRHDISRYLSLIALLGVREGDVPSRYRTTSVLRYTVVQLTMLLLVLPVAIVGTVYWFVPFLATRWIARRFKPKLDQVATYKLAVASLAFPTWLIATLLLAFFASGWTMALLLALALPVTGLAAVAWRDRQEVVLEDVRVFLRATRRSTSRERLAELRAQLVREIDDIARLWQQERRSRRQIDDGVAR